MELDNTNWVILRKKLPWGEASAICDKKYFRLAKLGTREKAQELVDKIESISEKYTPEYDKKYMEIEFGMDRRYWIGLTDQIEDGKWYWTHDGSELTYDFWYPNQPDHKKATDNSREHCVTLWNPGYFHDTYNKHTFNDEECLNTNYAICDKMEETPTTNPDPSAAMPPPAPTAGPPPPATDPNPPPVPAPEPPPDPGSS
ncbi:unnamed protein product [Orchesella dallaii]